MEAKIKRLMSALDVAVSVASEAWKEWDQAPNGMKAGKIIIALAGGCPGFRKDINEIHAALASSDNDDGQGVVGDG